MSRFMPYILLVLILSLAVPAAAQDAVTDDEVNAVAKELYCPVCESTPLDVCQTQACADWREVIRVQLSEGKSRQEIFDYFARQYGDRVLATPPRQGFNLLLWIWPIVALGIGLVFFSRYLRHLKATAEAEPAGNSKSEPALERPPAAPEDYILRVEQELKKG